MKKSYPIRYLSRSLPILRWARTILRNIDSTVVRFEPKPFGCQTEPLPLHSECLCTVLPILSIYSQLGYIGFSPPQLTTCPAMYTKKVIGLYISVSTRLVPYTICLMNSPPIGCTNSQHTVCSPTKCVIGHSAPTGNWRVKLGNGKLSLGFVEAIKVFIVIFKPL